jgi:hypothetical protein
MQYQISRNGQTYGPYTLDDLRRYLVSGNVLATDLAKNDEMADWVPVSQLVAGASAPPPENAFATPGFANPSAVAPIYGGPVAPVNPLAGSPYADAPNLHWGLYTLFAVITCTLFSKVFTVVQAAWLKRVQPNSNALLSYGVQYGILILTMVVRAATHTIIQNTGDNVGFNFGVYAHQNPIVSLLNLLYFIMIFVSRFVMRGSLEEHFNTVEPVGLQLSPVMTFFFGGIYFQYHLNRINAMKQAARLGGGRGY